MNQVDFLEDFDPGQVSEIPDGHDGSGGRHNVANGYDRSEEVISDPYSY